MFKPLSSLAIARAVLALSYLGAAPALALSPVTFVSGKGSNAGTCAKPENPCRSFSYAVRQTAHGGEVKVLDPAQYGSVVIDRSVSIEGIDGASIQRAGPGTAVDIKAGPNDKINLSHLTIDGRGVAHNGIRFLSGGSLTITHCSIRNFLGAGISVAPDGAAKFLIADTLVSNNASASWGVIVVPQGAGSAQGTLDRVSMSTSFIGLLVDSGFTTGSPVAVTAVNSVASDNTGRGFSVVNQAVLRLFHSTATGNKDFGVFVAPTATAESAGDNFIRGNGPPNVSGTLTNVGTQ